MATPARLDLASLFHRRATRTPDRPALTFAGETRTFAELDDRFRRTAAGLTAIGVGAGDRVAFLGGNHPAFLDIAHGCAALGAVFVPLNHRLTASELAFVLDDAGATVLVVDDAHLPLVDAIRAEVPTIATVVKTGSSDPEGLAALQRAAPVVPDAHEVDPDAVAFIMYTSGTTGRPKGAMLSHANLWASNVNQLHWLDIRGSDSTLVVAPLFHIGGLNSTLLTTWHNGGRVVLHAGFDPGDTLATIEAESIASMFAVPAMLLFMSQHDRFSTSDLSSLRTVICGGAPLPEEVLRTYESRGQRITQSYGLTETAPAVVGIDADMAFTKLGSSGKPGLLCDVKLIDTDGHEVTEPGARGEICARGPNVMLGYWNRPDATATAIDPDGWFHTGDIGHLDADGFLFVVDRVKDMVITGGENVYPAEVEAVLYEHPGVAEAAVIGLPDETWGERVVAVIAADGAEPTLDDIREHAGSRLAGYKLPRQLELVDELPRTPSGKVLKHELRARFGAGGEA